MKFLFLLILNIANGFWLSEYKTNCPIFINYKKTSKNVTDENIKYAHDNEIHLITFETKCSEFLKSNSNYIFYYVEKLLNMNTSYGYTDWEILSNTYNQIIDISLVDKREVTLVRHKIKSIYPPNNKYKALQAAVPAENPTLEYVQEVVG